jgi:hypothetical protein
MRKIIIKKLSAKWTFYRLASTFFSCVSFGRNTDRRTSTII